MQFPEMQVPNQSQDLQMEIKNLRSFIMDLTDNLQFWASNVGHENINIPGMMDQYGINPKYIDPYKNFLWNSGGELYNGSMAPDYWTGNVVSSESSSFDGSASFKLAHGYYMQTDYSKYTINPNWWQLQPTRFSCMKNGGTIKIEIFDTVTGTPIKVMRQDGTTGTYSQHPYNQYWNEYKNGNWLYGQCTLSFKATSSQRIGIRIKNVDDKQTAYIDCCMLSPDITQRPVLYKPGPRSTGYKGTEVKSIWVGTKAQAAAKTDWELKDTALFTDEYSVFNIIQLSTSTTLTAANMNGSIIELSGTITITLPSPSASLTGVGFIFKNTDANAKTIAATIDGVVNPTLTTQYQTMHVYCNGTVWRKWVA